MMVVRFGRRSIGFALRRATGGRRSGCTHRDAQWLIIADEVK
jgi:hypothetical protein